MYNTQTMVGPVQSHPNLAPSAQLHGHPEPDPGQYQYGPPLHQLQQLQQPPHGPLQHGQLQQGALQHGQITQGPLHQHQQHSLQGQSQNIQQPPQLPQGLHQSHAHQSQHIPPQPTPANIRRGPWSPLEDKKLLDLIAIFGPTNWVRISNSLATRTPKQCRERYHQNLKPSLNRSPITVEEGELIESLVGKYGKKWAEISRHLNGRSDNAIKNWWNGGANRRRRASVADDDDESAAAASGAASSAGSSIGASSATGLPGNASSAPAGPGSAYGAVGLSASSSASSSSTSASAPAFAAPYAGSSSTYGGSSTQIPHLPQISFNTSMFGKVEPAQTLPPLKHANPRSASFDINSAHFQVASLPPISTSNKRRLLDDPIARRHSTANSVYQHSHNSHSNLPSLAGFVHPGAGTVTPPSYGSPLLSTQASRNNSMSHFEFLGLNSTNSSSRRSSSIAPDLFPNPLKDSKEHKRNVSQNSSFNSPVLTPSTRFSVSSGASAIPTGASSNTSPLSNFNNASTEELRHKKEEKTKIAVSSLID